LKNILHVSSECYPAAKAGGMGDVVGALPTYLPQYGINASVVIPKYKTKWIAKQKFKETYAGTFLIDNKKQKFTVQKLSSKGLDFPLYCIDLPGLFDRESIYLAEDGHGFKDEPKRNIAFQTAVLEWLINEEDENFSLIHVHDHMTGLIPFFMQYCPKYKKLKKIPSVLSIHNGSYRGIFEWNEVSSFLPKFNDSDAGTLDWDGQINSLAAAIKCAWSINTVSPAYMLELIENSDTLRPLYESEIHKCKGILNGIDSKLWNPSTDAYLKDHLKSHIKAAWKTFKAANKKYLQTKYNLIARRPLIGFIGRFADQKGADLFLDAIDDALKNNLKFNAVILGSGDKELEQKAIDLSKTYTREVGADIAYNEKLARYIYAGCDFLIMPSRFEPCGLNQLYAMRYGTVPIASHVGGLKDTVVDISNDGEGIVINNLNKEAVIDAINRAIKLYQDKKSFTDLISKISKLDYSWNNSAEIYTNLYNEHLK